MANYSQPVRYYPPYRASISLRLLEPLPPDLASASRESVDTVNPPVRKCDAAAEVVEVPVCTIASTTSRRSMHASISLRKRRRVETSARMLSLS